MCVEGDIQYRNSSVLSKYKSKWKKYSIVNLQPYSIETTTGQTGKINFANEQQQQKKNEEVNGYLKLMFFLDNDFIESNIL